MMTKKPSGSTKKRRRNNPSGVKIYEMKKKKSYQILICAVFVFAFALGASGQTKTDIFGYYYIEKPTKDFSNISEIHLAGDFGAEQKPPFHGMIRLKSKKLTDFRLLKPNLNGKNLTFSTAAVGGISYKFTGAFSKLENFPQTQPNGEVLLTGTLTKYRGKTKMASANIKLSYQAGD